MIIKVYVSNLNNYIEGRENGKWLPLPMESGQLEKAMNQIVGKQESIILDYNAPFFISEYENIFELNNFLTSLSEYGIDEDIMTALFKIEDRNVVMEHIQKGEFCVVNVDEVSKNWSSILSGEYLYGMVLNEAGYNNLFSNPIPEELTDYMDFEQIYTSLSVNDGWRPVQVGNTTYLVTL